MNNLKSYNSFIKESVQEEEEEVWVPVEDKLGFYEPKKILKLLKNFPGKNFSANHTNLFSHITTTTNWKIAGMVSRLACVWPLCPGSC